MTHRPGASHIQAAQAGRREWAAPVKARWGLVSKDSRPCSWGLACAQKANRPGVMLQCHSSAGCPGQDQADQSSTDVSQTRPKFRPTDPHWRPAKDHYEIRRLPPPFPLPCHPQCSEDTVGPYILRYHFGEKWGSVETGKTEHLAKGIKSSQRDNFAQLRWGVRPGADSVPKLKGDGSNHKRPRYH